MKILIIAHLPGSTIHREKIRRFANWMGVETQSIAVDVTAEVAQQLPQHSNREFGLALDAAALVAIHDAPSQSGELLEFLGEKCADVLVFGCDEDSKRSAAVSWLTRGAVSGVTKAPGILPTAGTFYLPKSSREFSRQLAGLDFSSGHAPSRPFFRLGGKFPGVEPILFLDNRPVFLCVKVGRCRVFLVAGSEIPDIDEPITSRNGIEEKYNEIIPFLIFFRSCFGQETWHGIRPTARLIIDDPLLDDHYGLLDYSVLLNSMQREKYGTTIAFIPWNHRRTSKRWVEDLLRKDANFSICVHGCDHSNREFEVLEPLLLLQKAGLALERLGKHERRTGMPFERVMVFPQGRFSKSAILALRANGYLAAVNTSSFPVDYASGELRVGDFLRPAITRFHGFPVFHRHYPERLIDSAIDLFLDKPALLVEHHQYFGDGCVKLEQFLQKLKEIEPQLSWPVLSSQLSQTCMTRILSRDLDQVRFFTSKFRLKNPHNEGRRFILEKHEPDVALVREVLVDGKTVPFWSNDSLLHFDIEAGPNEEKTIEVRDHPQILSHLVTPGLTYQASVFFRRELSEFRDNTLSKNSALLRAGKRFARSLRLTGDRADRSESPASKKSQT